VSDNYSTNPNQIAEALEALAADIRAMPPGDLSEVAVTVYIQAHLSYGTPEERMRTVDAIGWHVAGATGAINEEGDGYRLPYDKRWRDRLDVSVFTDPRPSGGA